MSTDQEMVRHVLLSEGVLLILVGTKFDSGKIFSEQVTYYKYFFFKTSEGE